MNAPCEDDIGVLGEAQLVAREIVELVMCAPFALVPIREIISEDLTIDSLRLWLLRIDLRNPRHDSDAPAYVIGASAIRSPYHHSAKHASTCAGGASPITRVIGGIDALVKNICKFWEDDRGLEKHEFMQPAIDSTWS